MPSRWASLVNWFRLLANPTNIRMICKSSGFKRATTFAALAAALIQSLMRMPASLALAAIKKRSVAVSLTFTCVSRLTLTFGLPPLCFGLSLFIGNLSLVSIHFNLSYPSLFNFSFLLPMVVKSKFAVQPKAVTEFLGTKNTNLLLIGKCLLLTASGRYRQLYSYTASGMLCRSFYQSFTLVFARCFFRCFASKLLFFLTWRCPPIAFQCLLTCNKAALRSWYNGVFR